MGENIGEYKQIVSDVWEVALSVQDEMNKLQGLTGQYRCRCLILLSTHYDSKKARKRMQTN